MYVYEIMTMRWGELGHHTMGCSASLSHSQQFKQNKPTINNKSECVRGDSGSGTTRKQGHTAILGNK